jgi:hypothetical protein
MAKVIGLQFAEPLRHEGLKLLVLPADVERAIENGEEVCFKTGGGAGADGSTRAVLCTATATYRLNNVESSNVSFLADISITRAGAAQHGAVGDADFGGGRKADKSNVVVIGDQFASTMEMELEVPDFSPLRELIRSHVFCVDDDGDDANDESVAGGGGSGTDAAARDLRVGRGIRFGDLLTQTCASAAEIPVFLDQEACALRVPAVASASSSLWSSSHPHPDDRYFFVENGVLDEHFDLLLSSLMSAGVSLTTGASTVGAVVEACEVGARAGAAAVVRHLIRLLRLRCARTSRACVFTSRLARGRRRPCSIACSLARLPAYSEQP